MNLAVRSMLSRQECKTGQDYENALKEITTGQLKNR
jgi:hypothetical protein